MSQYSYDVCSADFEEKVLAASHRVPVIVDFWAAWCQPCRILKPILEKLAAEFGGRFLLAKVDSDANPELSYRYGVRGIPAVKAFYKGELIDEFTGALPESEVRAFLAQVIPSPAEPLRAEARALAEAGNLAAARDKIAQAIDVDPQNDHAYLDFVEYSLAIGSEDALQEAKQLLDTIGDRARDQDRVAALRTRLKLAESAGRVDIHELRSRVTQNPQDLQARLDLANALALRQQYREALQEMLEIVRRDRKWNDEAGRRAMIDLFNLLGNQPQYEDLVREFRIALARTLN